MGLEERKMWVEVVAVCVAFLLALLGAAFIFWLSDRAAQRRELHAVQSRQASDALLQEHLKASERLLLGLADRIQSPTPQAFAARQEAAAKAAVMTAMTPEERQKAAVEIAAQEREQTINDYFEEQRWRKDPELARYSEITPDGDEVVLEYEENGLPFMVRVPQGEFILAHVLRPRR